jgi:hypothetical protein
LLVARERLKEVWRQQRWMCLMVAALAVWGIVSLMWTNTDDPSREAKRLLYIGVSCCFPGICLWSDRAGHPR